MTDAMDEPDALVRKTVADVIRQHPGEHNVPVRILDGIEAIRLRPAMYIGSTEFFGFIQYLVCPVALLLSRHPTQLKVSVGEGGFRIESDVAVPLERTAKGRLAPFEEFKPFEHDHGFEATVLNALSESLSIEIRQDGRCDALEYRRGVCLSHVTKECGPNGPNTVLQFVPDSTILTVTTLSPAIFTSYLRRLSFLHPDVRFWLDAGNASQVFHAQRGLVDLFASVSAPYQFLHAPIQIFAQEGSAKLEAVFAYHSSNENALWCFINNGRAVEGGTHEMGLLDAIKQLHRKLKLPKAHKSQRNGVVGVMSLQYPGAVWEGCVKAKIGNPELRPLVCDWIVRQTMEWIRARPDVAAHLQHLQTFQFPEAWKIGNPGNPPVSPS